jgi:hypothetical protein
MRQIPQFAGPLATLSNITTTLYYLEPATWVDPQISPFHTTISFETDGRYDVGVGAMAAALVSRSLSRSLFLFLTLKPHRHSLVFMAWGGGEKEARGAPESVSSRTFCDDY